MARAKPSIKKAVALRYEAGVDAAPTVVASGQGLVAEKIVATAEAAGVAVREDPELASALAQVELGTAIPEELYPVVAEVLVFVSRMNQLKLETKNRSGPRRGLE